MKKASFSVSVMAYGGSNDVTHAFLVQRALCLWTFHLATLFFHRTPSLPLLGISTIVSPTALVILGSSILATAEVCSALISCTHKTAIKKRYSDMDEQLSYAKQDGTSIVYSGNPYVWPNPSALVTQRTGSSSSTGTVNRTSPRKSSSGAVGSSISTPPGTLRVRDENVVPSGDISLFTLDFLGGSTKVSTPRKASFQASRKSSWGTDVQAGPRSRQTSGLEHLDVNAASGETDSFPIRITHGGFNQGSRRGLTFETHAEEDLHINGLKPLSCNDEKESKSIITDTKPHVFSKWMRTLRRKDPEHKSMERWSLDESDEAKNSELPSPASIGKKHKKSSSTSSGFVTAVKSASTSLAALSAAPKSRKAGGSDLMRSSKRSSRLSHITDRASLESGVESVQLRDEAAWDRAIQRRRALEELVNSEESYIADLKVLLNVSADAVILARGP